MTDPIVTLDQVALGYAGHSTVIEQLTIAIAASELLGLTGASGSGKTTLLKALAGLLPPLAGAICWSASAHRRPAYCPQHDVLLDHRNVWENAVLLTESRLLDTGRVAERHHLIGQWLARAGLEDRHTSPPSDLSGGMRQRLQLVQVLAAEAEILLLDEPFAQQDRDRQQALELMLFENNRATGRPIILVSHDVDALAAICDRVAFLGSAPGVPLNIHCTPPALLATGGVSRRTHPDYADHAEALWRARAQAARP